MKKKILFLLLMICMGAGIFAQIGKIPSEVTEAFKKKFPSAQNVEWKDKLSNFEAKFTVNGTETTAEFTGKGEWQETNKKLTFDALPAAVKDGFKKSKYADWTPGSVTEIEKNDNKTQYKVYVEKSSLVQKRFLFFNPDGQLDKETPGI